MSTQMRAAVAADASALTAVAHAAKAYWGYPEEWIDSWRMDLTLTPEYIATHEVFVAEREGSVIGLAAVEEHADHWCLEHVWVLPAYQGRGVGRFLVERALDLTRRRPAPVRVTSDPHAARFYEQLGARLVADVAAPMPSAPDRTLPVYEFRAMDRVDRIIS